MEDRATWGIPWCAIGCERCGTIAGGGIVAGKCGSAGGGGIGIGRERDCDGDS